MASTRWIKPGIAVVHISNLEKILTVESIIYVSKEFIVDEEKVRKSRIDGVRCQYYDSEGELKKSVHHSKELVPADIANKGKLEAFKFINREGEYKDY